MPPANESTGLSPSDSCNVPADANANQGESSRLERGTSVELPISAFKPGDLLIYNQSRAHHITFTFNCVKHNMDKLLAIELAEFLPKAWEQSLFSKVKSPEEHEFYQKMRGTARNQKELYYPYWFFLAVVWGPGHPSLTKIRNDMAALWGVEFPKIYIHYPYGILVERQKALFHGGRESSIPLCEIQRRAQGFKAAIEGVGRPSVIEAVTQYAPALLNKAVPADDVESLHRKLKDTQEQLHKTQGQLKETQKRLQETDGELQEARKKLKNDIETSNKELAATNRRVDKVVDTCALVLSILTTPGGEKRKLQPEQDEA
ncbi:Hypothetical protein NCS54_00454700 [Fusarium falciforme]|uniref:Hypothetical protein n=1 Tax=Fusarium falciforme TaxID=195108 RepID=UPI002301D5FE|nr:Hypothetical protein NCS54_00454700 [Fusarium falciforme]WAO87243.1 Hypothetical protein NCS54_00454700 [Fusarium falciforme]